MGFALPVFTLLCTLLSCCRSLPTGAPKSACQSLTPKHADIEPMRTSPAYTVSAVKSGNQVTVIISSPTGDEFKGFVLQARSSKNKDRMVEGTFTSQNGLSKTVDCFSGKENTLTQVEAVDKRKVVTEWTPADGVNEDVIFRATVAQTYTRFWIEIDSSPVRVRNNVAGGSKTQQSDDSDSGNIYDDCFTSKGCFGLPSDCVPRKDCRVFLTYGNTGDGISFKMYGKLQSDSYMATGFSTDKFMGEDFVTECFMQNGRIMVRESWNDRRSNEPIRELPEGMFKAKTKDGLSSCSWVRPYMVETPGKSLRFDLANSTHYILLAEGPMANDRLRHHSDRSISLEKVNFTAFEIIEGERISDSVKIHGESEEYSTTSEPENSSSRMLFNVGLLFALLYFIM